MTQSNVRRERIKFFVLGAFCALAGVAGLLALRSYLTRVMPGSSASTPYGNRHYFRALAAQDQHRTEAAIREWQALEADGWGEVSTEPLVELLMDQQRYEEALVIVDRNESQMSTGNYVHLRARLLEQWQGRDVAVAWLTELDAEHPTSPLGMYWLGSFHLYSGRPEEALEPLLESVRRVCAKHGYRFDEHDSLVDVPPPPARDAAFEVRRAYKDDLGDFCSALDDLATVYEMLGDDAHAFQWATRDVSLWQRRNALSGYMDDKEVECGSLTGRILRARVFLRRGQLDEAAAELDFASHMTESRALSTQKRLDEAIATLARLREQQQE